MFISGDLGWKISESLINKAKQDVVIWGSITFRSVANRVG